MQKNPIDDEKTVFHCLMNYMSIIGLGLQCLTPLSTIFQLVTVGFIGGGNQSTQIITDLSQVTNKLYHITLYQVHLNWF